MEKVTKSVFVCVASAIFISYGLLVMHNSPDDMCKIDGSCDENIMLLGVHRCIFGEFDMIYSGEIHGVMDKEIIANIDDLDALNDRRFVFTKQMWKTISKKDFKFLKYWLQSYLANVSDLYLGYKTELGTINDPVEHLLTKDLPKGRFWKPSICTQFLYKFLQTVQKTTSSVNCPYTVYLFCYNRKKKCFNYDVYKGKNDKSFITEDYIKLCGERLNN